MRIFRSEIGRASNLRQMETILPSIPDESVFYHGKHNHFSSWLMARSEVMLASRLKPVKVSDFANAAGLKKYLTDCIYKRRIKRQKGVITELVTGSFDPDADFIKVGKGSLGGKARGLAFISTQLKENPDLQNKYKDIDIQVPKSLKQSRKTCDDLIVQDHLGIGYGRTRISSTNTIDNAGFLIDQRYHGEHFFGACLGIQLLGIG